MDRALEVGPGTPLRARVLALASGFRCGVVPPWHPSPGTFADLPGYHHVNIEGDTASTAKSSSGGVARTPGEAVSAAVGEALERYCGVVAPLVLLARDALPPGEEVLGPDDFALFTPAQRAQRGFPWPGGTVRYARVFSLADNHAAWVPHELVGLGPRVEPAVVPSTSTGLAAHLDPTTALLRAVQEVLERDALAVSWLHGVGGRELALPASLAEPVRARGGVVRAFELTQAWNPHPVVAVCGELPLRGTRRIAMGAACRGSWAGALDKAFLEWVQGVVFAGYYAREHPEARSLAPGALRDFVEHGAYYTFHPERWDEVPMLHHARPFAPPEEPREVATAEALPALVRALATAGVRLYYRDLTLPDAAGVGATVVRVLSPELSPLHADERAPFLGGRAGDLAWRYPGERPRVAFPSPHPHPLG